MVVFLVDDELEGRGRVGIGVALLLAGEHLDPVLALAWPKIDIGV